MVEENKDQTVEEIKEYFQEEVKDIDFISQNNVYELNSSFDLDTWSDLFGDWFSSEHLLVLPNPDLQNETE